MSFLGALPGTFGALAVIFGAFGSHALRERLSADQARVWQIAVQYHLLHSVAMFGAQIAMRSQPQDQSLRTAFYLWASGTVLFSGSLYLLALGYRGILGPITPVGGALLISGWVACAFSGMKQSL